MECHSRPGRNHKERVGWMRPCLPHGVVPTILIVMASVCRPGSSTLCAIASIFVVATGGGSGAMAALFAVPGASRSMLEAAVPYAPEALSALARVVVV